MNTSWLFDGLRSAPDFWLHSLRERDILIRILSNTHFTLPSDSYTFITLTKTWSPTFGGGRSGIYWSTWINPSNEYSGIYMKTDKKSLLSQNYRNQELYELFLYEYYEVQVFWQSRELMILMSYLDIILFQFIPRLEWKVLVVSIAKLS